MLISLFLSLCRLPYYLSSGLSNKHFFVGNVAFDEIYVTYSNKLHKDIVYIA